MTFLVRLSKTDHIIWSFRDILVLNVLLWTFIFIFFSQMATLVKTHTHPSCCTSLLVLRMMSSSTGVWRRDQGDSSSCSGCVKLVTSNHDNTGNTRISLHNYNIHLNVKQREICVGRKYISAQSKFSFFSDFLYRKNTF